MRKQKKKQTTILLHPNLLADITLIAELRPEWRSRNHLVEVLLQHFVDNNMPSKGRLGVVSLPEMEQKVCSDEPEVVEDTECKQWEPEKAHAVLPCVPAPVVAEEPVAEDWDNIKSLDDILADL